MGFVDAGDNRTVGVTGTPLTVSGELIPLLTSVGNWKVELPLSEGLRVRGLSVLQK